MAENRLRQSTAKLSYHNKQKAQIQFNEVRLLISFQPLCIPAYMRIAFEAGIF
jgi:hypothetical protein